MNMRNIVETNKDRIRQMDTNTPSTMEYCKVLNVDIVNMKLDVQLMRSGKVLSALPFCLPERFFDRGFIYLPEVGATAIVGTTIKQQAFIIGFISYSAQTTLKENILPGEIMIQSKGYSYIKEDNAGNVIIGSPSGNFIIVGEDGDISQFATTSNMMTVAKEVVSGIVNGTIAEIEKIYDKEVTGDLDIDGLVQALVQKTDVNVYAPLPVVTIEKGNVLDSSGNKLKLQIATEDPSTDSEMCYRITVTSPDGDIKMVMAIDKNGNAKISGNKLVFDFDTFDYSSCTNVIP